MTDTTRNPDHVLARDATLLDLFTAHALSGLLASQLHDDYARALPADLARIAMDYAVATIAERERRGIK